MKKYFILPVLAIALFLGGCKKNDGYITEEYLGIIDDVPVVNVKVDPSGSQSIDLTNLASFNGKILVKMYFPDATPPPKVDIVVRKNGSSANVRVFQAGVTTFPSTLTVTSAQIATLFGAPITLGDTYDFGADVYLANGTKYQTFPIGGIGSASGPVNSPGYSQFARFGAICAYNPEIYKGQFVVVQDDFEEYFPGDIVTLTKIDATHFSFPPAPSFINPIPVIVTVNPLTNEVTIPIQTVGTNFYQYFVPKQASVANALNNVSPCSAEFGVVINYTVSAGSFGNAYIKFRKL